MKQKLPHITPEMLRKQPNQTTYTLNQLIDKVNSGDISAKTTNNGGGGGGGSKVKLYNETGQNTDGAMTQKATTDALNNKVTKVAGKGLSTNDYTNDDKQKVNNAIVDANYVHTDNNFSTAYKTKLDGIQAGAEVNVQSDWTATDGDAFIKNKPTKVSDFTNDSDFQSGTQVNNSIASHNTSTTAHADIRGDINDIHGVIPSSATTTNQLADKDFVNSSINSVTAFYITKNAGGDQFNTKAELDAATKYYSGGEERTPTRNDYCIVLEDETKDNATTRYIYNNGWEFQYVVNETALTADQLAALNSGITASDVTKLDGIEAGAQKNLPNTVVDADYVHTDNNYTDTEKTKLSGIEEGAEKNAPDTVIDADYVHTDNNYTDDDKAKLDEIDTSKYLEKNTHATNYPQVYVKGAYGLQSLLDISNIVPVHPDTQYSLPYRDAAGNFYVSDPIEDGHVATKKYVDEHSSGDVPTKLSQLEDDINNVTYEDAGETTNTPWVSDSMMINQKVDVDSIDITEHSGTILDLVKNSYPASYKRWFTRNDGGADNITDKPTGSSEQGFVLESYKSRDNGSNDYKYRLVCRRAQLYSDTWEATVSSDSTSIVWYKVLNEGTNNPHFKNTVYLGESTDNDAQKMVVSGMPTATDSLDSIVANLRYSSGMMGSFNLKAQYTKDNIIVPVSWYNFIYIPHRSGGVNGRAESDNTNYGQLVFFSMTLNGGFYIAKIYNGAVARLDTIATTSQPAGTQDFSSTSARTTTSTLDLTTLTLSLSQPARYRFSTTCDIQTSRYTSGIKFNINGAEYGKIATNQTTPTTMHTETIVKLQAGTNTIKVQAWTQDTGTTCTIPAYRGNDKLVYHPV